MSQDVYWFVELALRPGALAQFLTLTHEMVQTTHQESGALIYERALSPDETVVIAHERYENSEAALEHLRHFHDNYDTQFGALVERKMFTAVGDVSEELRQVLTAVGARLFLPSTGFSRLVPKRKTRGIRR